jgi:hypothetical protein
VNPKYNLALYTIVAKLWVSTKTDPLYFLQPSLQPSSKALSQAKKILYNVKCMDLHYHRTLLAGAISGGIITAAGIMANGPIINEL